MAKIKPILYHDISEKTILEKNMFRSLTPHESLVHTLDMMDLFAAMRKERPHHPDDDEYPWIILKIKKSF